MAHHAIRRLGPTGLIAIFVALTLSLIGAGTAIAAAGGTSTEDKGATVAHTKAGTLTAPVTGTTDDGRTVTGTFTPRKFQAVNNELVAKGTLEGTITGGDKAPRTFHRSVTMPVEDVVTGAPSGGQAVGTCDILNLVLGPLDLNILGLEIHLDTVVLDIVANPAGGLLGDLLCAVANLLDGAGGLGGVIGNLLNQLIGFLEDILGQLGL
jgi:hypothetical protein